MIPITFDGAPALLKAGPNRVDIVGREKKLKFALRDIENMDNESFLANGRYVIETAYPSQLLQCILSSGCTALTLRQESLAENPPACQCRVNGTQTVVSLHYEHVELGARQLCYNEIDTLTAKPPITLKFKAQQTYELVFCGADDFAAVVTFLKAELPQTRESAPPALDVHKLAPARAYNSEEKAAKAKFLQTMREQAAISAIEAVDAATQGLSVERSFSESGEEQPVSNPDENSSESWGNEEINEFQFETAEYVLTRAENALLDDLGPKLFGELQSQLFIFREEFGMVDERVICKDIIEYVKQVFDTFATHNDNISNSSQSSTESCELNAEQPRPYEAMPQGSVSCSLVLKPNETASLRSQGTKEQKI